MQPTQDDFFTAVMVTVLFTLLFAADLWRRARKQHIAGEAKSLQSEPSPQVGFQVVIGVLVGMGCTFFGLLCFPAGLLGAWLSRLIAGDAAAVWFRFPVILLSPLGGLLGAGWVARGRRDFLSAGTIGGVLAGSLLLASPVVLVALIWSGLTG